MEALIDLINKNTFVTKSGDEAVLISGEQMAKLSFLINTRDEIKPLDLFTLTQAAVDQSFIGDCLKLLYIDDEVVRFEVMEGICMGSKYTRSIKGVKLAKLPDSFLQL